MNKVLYNIDQRNDTTDAQKTTARDNIGAASAVSLSEETARAIAAEVASATYDSENHLILFKNSANTQLFSLDATAFVMGGMIDSVVVEDGKLKITFMTESGTETVSVDIGDIFDANNYYTKSDTDSLLDAKQATVSTDTDDSAFSESTTIATGFSNNKVHLNTASRLWAWIKSQISSVLGLSENNGTKTYSGTADIADKVNYDTITSGNAYVPVFDHNGKKLKVVAGSRGLIMQKASDSDYALISCKSALAADADHAANSDKVNNHTVGTDVPANAIFTDTTYQNKAAASGGTDVSLVTTGEKYVWNNKVNAESGKGLSTNDFTSALKTKLDGIASGAEVNVQSDWNTTDTNADSFIKNKPSLATVAKTGSYNDLKDKPAIPASPIAGTAIDITGNVISTKVKSGGGISVDPSDGLYVPKVEVTFTLTNGVVTSDKTYRQLFLYVYNGYFIDAKLILGSVQHTLLSRNVSVSGSANFGGIVFTFFETTGNINKTVFEGVHRVIVDSDDTVSYRHEVLAPQPPYFTYNYVNGSWEFKTWQNREECTLTEFLNVCNNTGPGLGGRGLHPFGVIKYADGSNVYLPLSYGYYKNGEYHFEFTTTYRDVLASPVNNMLVTAIVDSGGISTSAFEV